MANLFDRYDTQDRPVLPPDLAALPRITVTPARPESDVAKGIRSDAASKIANAIAPDSALGVAANSIPSGIPIIGPYLDVVPRALAAGLNPVMSAIGLPAGGVQGSTIADAYKGLQQARERDIAAHPVANAVGQTTGSVMSVVPAARAFPAVFGGTSRLGQSAAGGVIGATDAAVRSGGDPTQTAVGGALGVAGPAIGAILAPVGQGVASAARFVNDKLPARVAPLTQRFIPPTGQELVDIADKQFSSLGSKMRYDPQSLDDLRTLITNDLYRMNKSGAIGAKGAIETIDKLGTLPPDPGSLHTIRKELATIRGGDEGRSAQYATKIIDNFMESPPPNAVTWVDPNLVGSIRQHLAGANENFRAGMNSIEARRQILEKGQAEASTAMTPVPFLAEGQAVRKNAKNFVNSDTRTKFLQPDEVAALKSIPKVGSFGEGLLRLGSTVSGTGRPGIFSLIPNSAAGIAGYFGAINPFSAAATIGAGIGSSAAQSALTRRAFEGADRYLRMKAPYSQGLQAAQAPPGVPPAPYGPRGVRDEIARLLSLQAERAATEP